MKVRSFTTRLIQQNTYLPYFPPDRPGQLVASLPEDNIKEILYHAMPNTWKKKRFTKHKVNLMVQKQVKKAMKKNKKKKRTEELRAFEKMSVSDSGQESSDSSSSEDGKI